MFSAAGRTASRMAKATRASARTGTNMVLREFSYALALGLGAGGAWKVWQWNDKARRVENNNAWDKYYPIYAQQVKADLEAADAAEAAAEAEPDAPEDQPDNEDRPVAADSELGDKSEYQPLPSEKREEGKHIPSKHDQTKL